VLTWWLTREPPSRGAGATNVDAAPSLFGAPQAGIVGTSASPRGPVPIYGLGWQGRF
jgi:hypothetical protein